MSLSMTTFASSHLEAGRDLELAYQSQTQRGDFTLGTIGKPGLNYMSFRTSVTKFSIETELSDVSEPPLVGEQPNHLCDAGI